MWLRGDAAAPGKDGAFLGGDIWWADLGKRNRLGSIANVMTKGSLRVKCADNFV